MPKYIVSAMIQAPANEPVDVNWYKGDDLARAIAAMTSAAVHDREVDDSNMPPSVRYRTLGVTLSIEQEVTQAPLRVWCNSHEGEHTFTDGSDGDTPCIGWRTEEDMVRATSSTDEMPTGLGICGAHNGLHLYDARRCQMWVPATTPSTVRTFNSEDHDYSLSNCVYYDMPQSSLPRWAYGDCAGPRVGLVQHGPMAAIMCEKHFNAMP